MTSVFSIKSALIGALLLATGACATAQEMRVAVSKVESGEWLWVAIYSGAAAAPHVESFVVLRDSASATGENLRVVQYTRDESWTSQAWTTAEPWEAINWIKGELGLTDNEDTEWGICNDAGVVDSQAPEDYTDGMLASDPWAPIVLSLADPASYIEMLVDLGYPAADLSVDNDASCSSGDVLNGLAGAFESMVANGDITVLSVGEGGVNCELFAAIGIPIGPTLPPVLPKPVTAPPWTPGGPAVPGSPSPIGPSPWTPGGWPFNWYCFTTALPTPTGSCFCGRKRYWGRWETTTCGCWPIRFPCIKWHVVVETESCSAIGGCGLIGGLPAFPPPGAVCTSTTQY